MIYGEAFAAVVEAIKAGTNYSCTVNDWVPAAGSSGSLAELVRPQMPANRPANTVDRTTCSSCTRRAPPDIQRRGAYPDSVQAAIAWSLTIDVRYQDRVLLPLPMFHVAALTTVIFCAMRGISLISMPQFDPVKAWSLIVEERVSIGGAVPAILNFMRQVPEFAELNAPDFRYFITGGSPCPRP